MGITYFLMGGWQITYLFRNKENCMYDLFWLKNHQLFPQVSPKQLSDFFGLKPQNFSAAV